MRKGTGRALRHNASLTPWRNREGGLEALLDCYTVQESLSKAWWVPKPKSLVRDTLCLAGTPASGSLPGSAPGCEHPRGSVVASEHAMGRFQTPAAQAPGQLCSRICRSARRLL